MNCNDEESSEDNVDDEINRDITAREPPRVSTSISRTTTSASIRRSMHIDGSNKLSHDDLMSLPILPSSPPHESVQDTIEVVQTSVAFKEIQKKMERAAKRQSITARFLSSLTGAIKNDNVRPSLDHVMSSFQSISNQPTSPITPPLSTHIINPIHPVEEPVKLTIDIAPPSAYHPPAEEGEEKSLLKEPVEPVKEPVGPVKVPVEAKEIERKEVVTGREEEEEAVEKKQVEEESVNKEEGELLVKKKEKDPIKEKLVEEEDSKLVNALADLDGVAILLDSVLETYLATVKSISNQKSLLTIENKLDQVVDKISKTIQKPDIPEQSPETIKLLEKYSSLLLNIVETKINSK
ncbi:MAG: hypothetical protein JSY10_25030 [Paenibacillus sp.]|nr:hypothetical protein [Paenibacillus sp.]